MTEVVDNVSEIADFDRNKKMLEAAHFYASKGFRVFPIHKVRFHLGMATCSCGTECGALGKHPALRGWQKVATTSASTITKWWARQFTGYGIGIATGKGSRVFVLEDDPRHSGDKDIEKLEARHGTLPATWTVRSGGGGLHRYFTYPSVGEVASVGKFDESGGLEIKSDGAFVVAAERMHKSGRRHELLSNTVDNPVAAPEWVLALARKGKPMSKPTFAETEPRAKARVEECGEERLRYYLEKTSLGSRHNDARNLILRLRFHDGLSKQQAQQLAVRFWESAPENADDSFTFDEVMGLLDWCFDPAREPLPPDDYLAENHPDGIVYTERDYDRHLERFVATREIVLTPNNIEDRATRKASLRPQQWEERDSQLVCRTERNISVVLAKREGVLPAEEAQAMLRGLGERTVLNVRIAMALYDEFRYRHMLNDDGRAFIPVERILELRGIKKHSTDSYRIEDVEAVVRDLEVAACMKVRGTHITYEKGEKKKPTYRTIDSHYLDLGVQRKRGWGEREQVEGVWLAPGAWAKSYRDTRTHYLAPVNRGVFALNLCTEAHEMRIAFFLHEHWRLHAYDASQSPIEMGQLLEESVIEIDRGNLTNRFIPRIERALAKLRANGVIGLYGCIAPVDRTKRGWGEQWLASTWRILPPGATIDALNDIVKRGEGPQKVVEAA